MQNKKPIDEKPRNEKGEAHGCWITHYTNGYRRYKINWVNGVAFGYWELNPIPYLNEFTPTTKRYYAR
jgi:hypothetical protein